MPVNDFSLQVATANGSGSQSSNTVLLRTLFQMGIPVSGHVPTLADAHLRTGHPQRTRGGPAQPVVVQQVLGTARQAGGTRQHGTASPPTQPPVRRCHGCVRHELEHRKGLRRGQAQG